MSSVYPYPFDFAGSVELAIPAPDLGAIYGLYEPTEDVLRYIGQTRKPAKRLWDHCYPRTLRKRTHKNQWIKSLLAQGRKPRMRILLWVPTAELDQAECAYIAEARRRGLRLTNETEGGNGVNGYVPSAEERARSSARHKGKTLSPEHRRKVAEAVRGHWQTEERRRKQHAAMAGRVMSEQARANMSAAHRGKKLSPDHCANISAALIGRKMPPESVARSAAAKKGRRPHENALRAASLALKGKPLSAEHRAKIAAGLTGYKRPPMSPAQRALLAERGRGKKQSPATIKKRVDKVRATWARKRAAAQVAQLALPFDDA